MFRAIILSFLFLTSAHAELEFGDDAPYFRLYDQDGFAHCLSSHFGKYVLLFFYERDFTSFAIRGVKAFEKMYQTLKEKDVVIYGISNDFQQTHQKFHQKCGLTYDLLSDPDKDIIAEFGAKSWFGTRSICLLIGPDGRIFRKYEGGDITSYPRRVLQDLQ